MNNSLKHIDINLIMDIFGGDEEIICDSIDVFSEIANNYFTTILEAHEEKNWHLLSTISHKAKASCRTMGMTQLGNSLEKVERNAKGLKFCELMDKKDLNKEEEKLFTSIQKSGCTQGNEKTINNEITLIKLSFEDAIEEIRKFKLELIKS